MVYPRDSIKINGSEVTIPAQQLLDRLTRSDEIAAMTLKAISQMSDYVKILAQAPGSSRDIATTYNIPERSQLINRQVQTYAVRTVALDSALTDQKYDDEGYNMVAVSDGSLDSIFLRLNHQTNDLIPAKFIDIENHPFYKLYVTSPAQAGKTLYLVESKIPGFRMAVNQTGIKSTSVGIETIFSAAFGAVPAGTYYTSLVDVQVGQKVVMLITNTLDQAVTVQAIGNIRSVTLPAGGFATIGIPVPVAALTGINTIGVSDVYWHPYIGGRIVVAANPTAGSLKIEAIVQE